MRIKLILFITILFFYKDIFCQNQTEELIVPLQLKSDSTGLGKFNYIQPNVNIDSPKIPLKLLKAFTLSRYLDLRSINIHIPVLIGIANNGYPVIIFDRNQNKDFTDDSVIYFYDTLKTTLEGNYKTISIDLKNNLNVTFDFTIVKPPSLSINTGNAFENNFFLAIRPWEYRVGEFEINNKKINVYFLTKILYHFDRMWSDIVIATKNQDSLSLNEFLKAQKKFKLGDKIDINDNNFIIKSISSTGTELTLEKLTDNNTEGINVGFIAPSFDAVSITYKPISLKENKGSYILLDYWGTWCGPCKMVLPDLKKFSQRFPKLKMIGVAFDDYIKKVQQFVHRDSINWSQVFVDRSKIDSSSLCAKYNVENYPTFILINPEGKIIFRDMGIDGFNRLENYLAKIAF